jgi:hypothetical protein
MSDNNEVFMIGDCVFYSGNTIKSITGKAKAWLHSQVGNDPGVWVVEYSETKQRNSYLIHESELSHYKPSKAEVEKHVGPIVQPRHSKLDDDTE